MEGKGKRSREDEDSETLRFESRSEEVEGECRFLWGEGHSRSQSGSLWGVVCGHGPDMTWQSTMPGAQQAGH